MLSPSLNQEKALIFRITHAENLGWILDNGLHARNSEKKDPQFTNIGNSDLINKRNGRTVPVEPGGTLSDYIPFYFTPYSIMLYNIHTGYGGLTRVPNRDIIILVSSLHKIHKLGLNYAFTSGHAYPVYADYYNDLNDLNKIDWALLQNRDFKTDPDDPAKKERYQAEALVHRHLPVEALHGIACYDKAMQTRIETELKKKQLEIKVLAKDNYYF